MNYENFYKKYVDDLNLEELNWIKNNSYINNYPYYGQKIILTQKLILDNLSKNFEIFKQIEVSFNIYKKNNDLNSLNILVKNIQLSFVEIYNNIDIFLTNEIFLKEFISMYHIIRFIENEFFGKNKIINTRWKLWHNVLIRDIESFKNNNIVIARAIPWAENGNYEMAEKLLDYNLQNQILENSKNINVFISINFYKHKFRIKLNKDYNEIFQLFDNKISSINIKEIWALTRLKISEFYLENFIKTKNENSLNNYKKWFKLALEWYKQEDHIQTIPAPEIYNNKSFSVSKNNIEIIREPILNMAFYYYSIIEIT